MISIYQRAMGSDFLRLHPEIQRRFSITAEGGMASIGTGVMDKVWHGAPYTLPFLYVGTWRSIMFPDQCSRFQQAVGKTVWLLGPISGRAKACGCTTTRNTAKADRGSYLGYAWLYQCMVECFLVPTRIPFSCSNIRLAGPCAKRDILSLAILTTLLGRGENRTH